MAGRSPKHWLHELACTVWFLHKELLHTGVLRILMFAELEGLPRELILEAVKVLEVQHKAKLFKGTSADDIGIKFFA